MGLFSGFGKKSPKSRIAWLNKVNDVYMKAFVIKNATLLQDYMTRTCLVKTMERVRLNEKAFSGLSRYQNTSWTLGTSSAEEEVWLKTMTYDDIKMSHGIVVPMGTAEREEWQIVDVDGSWKVNNIRRT